MLILPLITFAYEVKHIHVQSLLNYHMQHTGKNAWPDLKAHAVCYCPKPKLCIQSLSVVSLCWSVRMSNFNKAIICQDAPVMKLWILILWIQWKCLITILILQPPTDLNNSISYFWISWIIIGIISGEPDMKPEGSGFYVYWTLNKLYDPVCQLGHFQLSIIEK